MSTSFVQSLDVEEQQGQQQQAAAPSWRRAFGMGVLAGGMGFAVVGAAVALFQVRGNNAPYSSAAVNGFVPGLGRMQTSPLSRAGTAPLPSAAQTDQTLAVPAWSMTAEQRQLIQTMAAPDGIATRAAVEMFAKSKKKPAKKAAKKAAKKTSVQGPTSFTVKPNEFCYGLPGSTAPGLQFDPAGLSKAPVEDVLRWREAEVTHGRLGMLASLGFINQETFHPFFDTTGASTGELFSKTPPAVVFGILFATALCEGYRGTQIGNPGRIPGDIGFDPLGLKPSDPAEFLKKQEAELNNGRLGMIAAAGFLVQEATQGTTFSNSPIFEALR